MPERSRRQIFRFDSAQRTVVVMIRRGTIKITEIFRDKNLKETEFKEEFAGFLVKMYNGGINEVLIWRRR